MRKSLLSIIISLVILCMGMLCPENSLAQIPSDKKSNSLTHTPRKGAIDIRANTLLPLLNWLYYTDQEHGKMSRIGFGMWNLGVDYYQTDNVFINFTIGESYDLMLPASITYGFGGKDSEKLMILHCSFSNNHRVGVFSFGYGLSYGYDRWKMKHYNSPAEDTEKQHDDYNISYLSFHSLGFVFPVYCNFGHDAGAYIGIVYRPMLIQISDNAKFKYQHTLSLVLGFRLRVKR